MMRNSSPEGFVRTLLIDDHVIFTKGLEYILSDLDESMDFVHARSVEEALSMDGRESVSLVLLDFHLPGPGMDGLDGLGAVKAAFESAVIVMLSSEDDPKTIRDVVTSGASGFIPKSSKPDVMIAALKLVLAGGAYLPQHVLSDIPAREDTGTQRGDAVPASALAELSARQREVFMKAAQGKINKVIAYELGLKEGTVKFHLAKALHALGLKNRYDAVYFAAKMGLTQAESD
jgi:DNA-binding NarL/FixJ family response regulator